MRALIALLIAVFFSAPAFAADLHFNFNTFKVRTHFTEEAASLQWNEKVFPFEIAFKYGSYREMANQPHRWFGGKYVLVEAGCGTSCQVGVLVNRQTGRVIPNSNLPVAGSSYEYRYNSALLVVNPTSVEILANRDYFPDQTTYYYVWTTTGWKKLAEEPWPPTISVEEAMQAALKEKNEETKKMIDDLFRSVQEIDHIPIPLPRPYK
ncbi:hypothetical protein A2392_02895 [Candidatus Kaiserbacteria bacterium RIFOXYB1_FULL_46_14]|uniref:DUF4136 domain-containing protein n=1 Tax=Candidatus Kaiserbacteria bacterium RIFOXYB1_FULL_46_14 TaxID=1798531 RepID=A0A1F6FIN3_9BACT|nr:MAG: hypothetical protein A2392_02895 [Candidatus Kaiserbacteria bacterium RIFOXYB1_FULL_46_14]